MVLLGLENGACPTRLLCEHSRAESLWLKGITQRNGQAAMLASNRVGQALHKIVSSKSTWQGSSQCGTGGTTTHDEVGSATVLRGRGWLELLVEDTKDVDHKLVLKADGDCTPVRDNNRTKETLDDCIGKDEDAVISGTKIVPVGSSQGGRHFSQVAAISGPPISKYEQRLMTSSMKLIAQRKGHRLRVERLTGHLSQSVALLVSKSRNTQGSSVGVATSLLVHVTALLEGNHTVEAVAFALIDGGNLETEKLPTPDEPWIVVCNLSDQNRVD